MNNNKIFNDNGFIIKENFITNKDFQDLSKELNAKIEEILKKQDLSKIGGSIIGNVALYPGNYGKKILDLLILNGFGKIIEEITNKKIENFIIKIGGNLSLPNKHNQHFHMDGRFKDKMLLASIATSNVDEISGPTEIVLNYHQKNIPYWKFLLLPKKKMKLKLKLGDLMIRKHCLWHRGTINRSKNPRFVIAFLIFEKTIKNEYSLHEDGDEIKIYNNFFGNSLLERLKEFFYVYLGFLFAFYKILRSFKN
jgi:hypothetical protein